MKRITVVLALLLTGCGYILTVNKGSEAKNYPLYTDDFIIPTNAERSYFKKGNVNCFEFTRPEDGYTGCCCDGEFNKKALDRIHRCGH